MESVAERRPHLQNVAKVHVKNEREDSRLRQQLGELALQKRVSQSRMFNELFEEKQLAFRLKKTVTDMKDADLQVQQQRDTADRRDRDSRGGGDRGMTVSGHNFQNIDFRPKMFFWSQDASTKLPTVTGFYGFEHGFQRSATELKLLGQTVQGRANNEPRNVQTARPGRPGNSAFSLPQRSLTADGLYTRDSGHRGKGDKSETGKGSETKGDIHLAPVNSFAKIYKNTNNKDSEEKRLVGSAENLPDILTSRMKSGESKSLWVGDPLAIGSVRRPRKRIAEMLLTFKTREEARRVYRAMMAPTPCKKCPPVETELDKSYNNIPHLVCQINRLKGESDTAPDGKQYSKSAFGSRLQKEISKKVLNKDKLPVPFRRSNNTYLKHYGTEIMKQSTPRHYTTPDIDMVKPVSG